MKKLLIIQTELKAPKGQYNNFGKYNYRSAEDILEAVKPLIAKNNCLLTLSDELVNIGERYYIKATAKLKDLESNEVEITTAFAREEETKKGMDGSQITGASSSYARKYALNGLFNIDDNKDSDATNKHGEDSKKNNDEEFEKLKIALKEYTDKEELKNNMIELRDQYVAKGVLKEIAQSEIKRRLGQLK